MAPENLIPVGDDGLEEIADALSKSIPAEPKEEPEQALQPEQGNIAGIVIGDNKQARYFDCKRGTLEKIGGKMPAQITALGYHDGRLWVGASWNTAYLSFKFRSYVGPVTDVSQERKGATNCFFIHNGKLYDAGEYGITETETGVAQTPQGTVNNNNLGYLPNIHQVFMHKGKLHAIHRNGINELDFSNSTFSFGKSIVGQFIQFGYCPAGAASAHGSIIQAGGLSYVETDDASYSPFKGRSNMEFRSIAFDESHSRLFASGYKVNGIRTWIVSPSSSGINVEVEGWNPKSEVFSRLSRHVYALLPVTEGQIEKIREQVK